MSTLKTLVSASLCLGFTCALPAQKQWESSVSVEKDENTSDPSYGLQIIRNNVPITYGPNLPWNETAFVERVGYLDLSFSYLDTSRPAEVVIFERYPPITYSPDIELSTENEHYAIGYTHRKPGSAHVLSASFGYQETKSETLEYSIIWSRDYWGITPPEPLDISYSIREFEEHIFDYTLGYDYYLTDNWTAGAEANLTEYSFADLYSFELNTRSLWKVGSDWLSIEGAISRSDFDIPENFDSYGFWTIDANATYYFTPKTGIGLGMRLFLDEGFEDIFSLSFEHYFTKNFSAQAAVEYHKLDIPPDFDDESFDYTLRLGYRF